MGFFDYYVVSVNLACLATATLVYVMLPPDVRKNRHAPGFLAALFLVNRTILEFPIYAPGIVLAEDYILVSAFTVAMVFYVKDINFPREDTLKALVVVGVTLYCIARSMIWIGSPAFILFYTVSTLVYWLAWRRDPAGLYALKLLFALSMISDMRELVHVYNLHYAHWFFHVKPVLWLFIAPLIREHLRLKPKNIALACLCLALSNLLDYYTHGAIPLQRLVGVEGSAFIVRIVATPAPLFLLRTRINTLGCEMITGGARCLAGRLRRRARR